MVRRWPLLVTFLAGVAVLAVWVAGQAPSDNPTVYAYDTAVRTTVATTDPDLALTAIGIDSDLLDAAGVYDAQAGILVTSAEPFTLSAVEVADQPGWTVQPALVEQAGLQAAGPVAVPAGLSLLALRVVETSDELGFAVTVFPLDRPVQVDLPILVDGASVGTVTAALTPVPAGPLL